MPTPIIMPKFEMAQETGMVSKWLKQEGDPIEKGEPILEVETDKINMEVESPASGILGGISAGAGAVVPIGQTIAYILKPGESLPQADAPTSPAPKEAVASPSTDYSAERVTPVAERVAHAHGLDLQALPRSPGQGRLTKADVESYLTQQPQIFAVKVSSDKIKAVPAARRLAHELSVDLAAVKGSGPDGRIQSADVQQAAAQQKVTTPTAETLPTPLLTVETGQPAIRRTVPLNAMRRTIAERLTASVREIPQFTVSMDVEMRRALEVVEDLREVSEGTRVTLTAVLVKACAWVLARHPTVNASFGQQAITEWVDINVGVAVSVESGLLVPVVQHADRLSTLEIAAQLTDLGQRARDGKLQLRELQGGTFTLSNLGMFGADHFTAIINPPQAAILAVSRAVKRPVVTDDNQIEVKLLADFTLTADQRLLDGARAAQFLADLKHVLEHPGTLL